MGLDITAYTRLELTEPHSQDDMCYASRHVHVWNEEYYQDRADGLLVGRCYTSSEKPLSFRAGSYSGYNDWRSRLALMAQSMPAKEIWDDPVGPFAELINFSDCEGTIGPIVAAKLAKDFQGYRDRAEQWGIKRRDEWFFDLYQKWQQAMEMASDGGLVSFG